MALMAHKNAKIIQLLANKQLFSTLSPQNQNLLRQSILYEINNKRNTSTTSTSKGQAISITNLANENVQQASSNNHNQNKLDLSFEDSKTAFKSKTNLQLLRGYLVFQLCSFNILVDNQKAVIYF
jgi:hypothetical protein